MEVVTDWWLAIFFYLLLDSWHLGNGPTDVQYGSLRLISALLKLVKKEHSQTFC